MNMATMDRKEHKSIAPGFNPDALIDAMRAANMSTYDLSEATGISPEAIARWVGGIAEPKAGYARMAAKALSVSVDDFYK